MNEIKTAAYIKAAGAVATIVALATVVGAGVKWG
jgi:hypothetical protein